MTRWLAALLLVLGSVPTFANGVSAKIDDYVSTLDERKALEAIPGVADLSDRYANVLRREHALAGELDHMCAGSDDLADIVVRERAKRLTAAHAEQPVTAFERPVGALTGAEGAITYARPLHSAPVNGAVGPWTRVTLVGRAGEWLALEGGRFVHGSLVELDSDGGTDPGVPAAYKRIHDQKPTYFITAREQGFPTSGVLYGRSYNGTERKKIQTPAGDVIAETSGRFFACLVMEGSGVLVDGRAVSFASGSRFDLLPANCMGRTSTGAWVVSYHTLAVNPREMAYGTVYFIPRTLGMVLPDGTVHGGFWFAHDTGSAFQGTPKHRMDMYVNLDANIAWSEAHITPSFTPLPVYRVDPATQRQVLEKYKDVLGPPSRFAAR